MTPATVNAYYDATRNQIGKIFVTNSDMLRRLTQFSSFIDLNVTTYKYSNVKQLTTIVINS